MQPYRFTAALTDLIEKFKDDIHTALPAKIVSVDYDGGLVEVAPLVKNPFSSQKSQNYPNLSGVPLMILSANGGLARLTLPVIAGDVGMVIFSERDPTNVIAGDGSTVMDPSQVVPVGLYPLGFICGISTAGTAKTISSTDISLENDKGSVTLKPAGDVTAKNSVGSVSLAASGAITLNSGSASFVIGTDGTIKMTASGGLNLNGLKISSDGLITDGSGIEYSSHIHTIPDGDSGPPINA